MKRSQSIAWGTFVVLASVTACNAERQQECDKLLTAMKPLDQGALSAETVDRIRASLAALQFQDEPLREYARNASATLTVLSNTLGLQADDAAPDGTNDVVKDNTKQARGERDDVARYCSP